METGVEDVPVKSSSQVFGPQQARPTGTVYFMPPSLCFWVAFPLASPSALAPPLAGDHPSVQLLYLPQPFDWGLQNSAFRLCPALGLPLCNGCGKNESSPELNLVSYFPSLNQKMALPSMHPPKLENYNDP